MGISDLEKSTEYPSCVTLALVLGGISGTENKFSESSTEVKSLFIWL